MDSFVHITSPTHAAIHEDVFIPTETLLHDPEPWLESLGFIISLEQGGGLGTACGLRSNEWDQWWDIGVWGPAMRHAGGIPERWPPWLQWMGECSNAPEEEVTGPAWDGLKPI